MDNTIDQFLASYNPEICTLALQVRSLVLEVMPGAIEQVDVPSKLIAYGYGKKYADLVFTLMPTKAWVTLGVYRGSHLPDPHGLLEGTGKVHRHVKVRTKADLESPALKKLMQDAVAAKGVR
jgi:hypothetical protein